jgi:hypothetical protein
MAATPGAQTFVVRPATRKLAGEIRVVAEELSAASSVVANAGTPAEVMYP